MIKLFRWCRELLLRHRHIQFPIKHWRNTMMLFKCSWTLLWAADLGWNPGFAEVNCRSPTDFSRFSFPHFSPLQPFSSVSLRLGSETLPHPQLLHQTTCSPNDYRGFFLPGLHRNKNEKVLGFFHCPWEMCLFLIKVLDICRDPSFLANWSLGPDCSTVLLCGGDNLM